MRASRLRSRRGFSLLELVVLLVFVGIVGVASTGKVSAIRAQQQVARGASLIQTQMEQAFALAGRNRAPIRLSWNSTTLVLSATDRAGTTTYGRVYLSNYGFKSSEIAVTTTPVEVFPNGFASDTLSITITTTRGTNTYTKRVRMSRAGLVKVI
jgi:type II secretory pathway pseudopilin PulG